MSKTLEEIAAELKTSKVKISERKSTEKKVDIHLIYAFNGTGKTRLSKEFKKLFLNNDIDNQEETTRTRFLYYNAFTEDLFYWDNDLINDESPKLKIQPNSFTNWVLQEQGQDQNIISIFQRYTDEKLNVAFNQEYYADPKKLTSKVEAFSEVTFSFQRGNDEIEDNIKISKGEESCFVWSIFYSLLELVIENLNIAIPEYRENNQFNELEYIFIDDPVSSLDENHLIELAIDLAKLIKESKSELKFVITTHNPLFYNVLHNELNNKNQVICKYILSKNMDGFYDLKPQRSDSPFSYHLFLKNEIENAITNNCIHKYHFNYLRNILEKTSTFLGYERWGELLEPLKGSRKSYEKRIIDLSSHSKHSAEEISELNEYAKLNLKFLIDSINETYRFKK